MLLLIPTDYIHHSYITPRTASTEYKRFKNLEVLWGWGGYTYGALLTKKSFKDKLMKL
jgi:hypothetical protein